MSIRLPYETKGGEFSVGETQMQLLEYLRLAAECCYTIGHFHKANDEELLGQGWLGMGQMFENNVSTLIRSLAQRGKLS